LAHRVYAFFVFYSYRVHLDLHSFPTRRSSDLDVGDLAAGVQRRDRVLEDHLEARPHLAQLFAVQLRQLDAVEADAARRRPGELRSEEHTSELQSRVDLVCRLLLEKKKTT